MRYVLQIDTSMTIHIQGGVKCPLTKAPPPRPPLPQDERSSLREDIVPLMLKGDAINVQWGFDPK
jgi:hypothetical protein